MKLLLIKATVVLTILPFALTLKGLKQPENDKKITICHIPPGNPANMHEITISVNALQAHLDHGDIICQGHQQ